ncbi:hypothetical protein BVX94_02845, partial [bacterium B17]
ARQAETCGQYLSKGSPVLVEGSLQLDKWQTKEGENRSKLRVRAARVQFLGSRPGGDAGDGAGAQSAGRPQDDGGFPPDVPPANDAGDKDNLPF